MGRIRRIGVMCSLAAAALVAVGVAWSVRGDEPYRTVEVFEGFAEPSPNRIIVIRDAASLGLLYSEQVDRGTGLTAAVDRNVDFEKEYVVVVSCNGCGRGLAWAPRVKSIAVSNEIGVITVKWHFLEEEEEDSLTPEGLILAVDREHFPATLTWEARDADNGRVVATQWRAD